ncbi:hypothetical protein DMC15_06900 [Vibrio sp. 11986-1-5]|nr:hypothetical protein DMC15_06900 [Vibrio sp. 11986-1-5]
MKYRFIIYGFSFFTAAFIAMGIMTLMSLFVSDREAFSSLLSDLGSFGSFLSGVGTIFAAAAAAYGIDTWAKQLKSGKYLTHIWECKALLSQFDYHFINWDSSYQNPLDLKGMQNSHACEALNNVLSELKTHSLNLDSIPSQNSKKLISDIHRLRVIFDEHKCFLDSKLNSVNINHDGPVKISNDYNEKKKERFDIKNNHVKKLQTELDILEKIWS